jgi:putative membrane-bound dehydrogenase-like protein
MRFLSTLFLALIASAAAFGQGFSPQEAVKRMQLPPGFTVRVVAHEPMIRQPVSISFDDRGRMWVLQYLQYPNPAGLKPVKQDQYLRTVWDKVLDPPPRGPKGLDRITICYDPDDHGVYRKSKDFLTGLNLASGFCLGNGGVYVVQAPYLLYYPDKDGDDVPDGDPEVLLKGFGLDDTHSLANSLQWGPDGWLYGAAGSTSTCKIPNPAKPEEVVEFQQGIWRYHPKSKRFELFSEGGGNTYGLDFDKHGQVIAGTNWGGFAMLHQMQGAYHVKGFSKHGPLHNPHSYGYFEHVPYKDFKGGHVTCGGIVYQGDTFPTEMRDQYIAGNLLSSAIYWHKMSPNGSTFTAKHGGDLLVANDTWHRPVDLQLGPDGSVYVADWYDKRAAHLDPIDNWDKTNGRVYKIEYQGTPKFPTFDLRTYKTKDLVELLKHPSAWWRREARRLLVERNDPKSQKLLEELELASANSSIPLLEVVWTQFQLGQLKKENFESLLDHKDPHVRAWAVRTIVEGGFPIDLTAFVHKEEAAIVLAQVACSAKRLPIDKAWPIINHLIDFELNADDPYIPLLTWWAIEHHMTKSESLPKDTLLWCRTMMEKYLLERIIQRLTHLPKGFETIANLLRQASGVEVWRKIIIKGINAGITGKKFEQPPKELVAALEALLKQHPQEAELQRLAVRFGDAKTVATLLDQFRGSGPTAGRVQALQILAESRRPELPAELVSQFPTADAKLRAAIIAAMTNYSDARVDEFLLRSFPAWPVADRASARRVLFTRPATALQYLQATEAKKLPAAEVPLNELRPLLQFNDKPLSELVEKLYGKIGPATPGEKQARITWVGVILNKGKGDPTAGKELFAKHCATCHQLFGEGNKIGPDLTTADRKNTPYMVANVVDPSSYVRTEYVQHEVSTHDGRKLTGLVVDATAKAVTVLDAQNRKTVLARDDVEDLKPSAVSMMPDKLLDTLSDQQICDLFAYLRLEPPKK